MVLNLVLRSGCVVDGAGNPWFRADVGIKNGKVVKVGHLDPRIADRVIEVDGLMVSPGFINIHSHSEGTLLINPKAESVVRQGITTEVTGNCGFSLAPICDGTKDLLLDNTPFPMPRLDINWRSFSEYLERLKKRGVAVNVASLVGHGAVRIAVMGLDNRTPTPRELNAMKGLVAEAMKAGGFGLSSGLAYPPGFYAGTQELIELCKVVSRYHGFYASHIRGEGANGFIQGVVEAVEIGEKAHVPVQVSHIETHYPAWGRGGEALRLVDEARMRGVDVTCDVPPYILGYTALYTLLPDWVHEGGAVKLLERLRGIETREKIEEDVREQPPRTSTQALVKDGHWDRIVVSTFEAKPGLEGMSLAEVAQLMGKDPFNAVFDMLSEGPPFPNVMAWIHHEEDIRKVMRHSTSMVETDLYALAPYGCLAEKRSHPRGYGTFPMVFRKYVRGETLEDMPLEVGDKILTLEEAVRKMTSLPAQRLGLRDRGLIREGMWADVTVFNPKTVKDRATYEKPNLYPEGVEYVLVNGQVVVEEGENTGLLPGTVLRRSSP